MTKGLSLILCTFLTAICTANAYIDDHPLQGYKEAQGNFLNKVTYSSNGENHVVMQTESGYFKSTPDPQYPENICMNNEIHVYDFGENSKVPPVLKWKLYDFVHDCETSARLEFSKDSPMVTDLDGDGRKEVWISYYKGCHGDVSPDELKVFMYRDGVKHSIRGQTHVFVDGNFYGGDFKMDQAMKSSDRRYQDFGVNLFRRLAEDKH